MEPTVEAVGHEEVTRDLMCPNCKFWAGEERRHWIITTGFVLNFPVLRVCRRCRTAETIWEGWN